MIKLLDLILESNTYSYSDVLTIQKKSFMSSDILFDVSENDTFIKTKVKIDKLTINGNKPKVSLSFYRRRNLDEDISITMKLINMYKNNINVAPIVVTREDDISDGIHRYVAQKEVGYKIIDVFKQI